MGYVSLPGSCTVAMCWLQDFSIIHIVISTSYWTVLSVQIFSLLDRYYIKIFILSLRQLGIILSWKAASWEMFSNMAKLILSRGKAESGGLEKGGRLASDS